MIPIVLTANNKYVQALSTIIASILKNSNENNYFEFNILTTSITDENKELIKSLYLINNNSGFNFIDMKPILKNLNLNLEEFISRANNYFSIDICFRFFIPELFPHYKKMLYLDTDILVFEDIKELYDEDIENFYVGAVRDTVLETFVNDKYMRTNVEPQWNFETYFKEKLNKTNELYFNSGVLLLNLEKIRNDNIVPKLWAFAQEKSPLEFFDQDILNAVFDTSVKFIDYKWNTLKDLKYLLYQIKDINRKNHLLETIQSPGIYHYVGPKKPWMIDESSKDSFDKLWWEYYKLTPHYQKEYLPQIR